MTTLTDHVKDRTEERANQGYAHAKKLLDWLWVHGRTMEPDEFRRYQVRKLRGKGYRIAQRHGCTYVVVRAGDRFVTLIKLEV